MNDSRIRTVDLFDSSSFPPCEYDNWDFYMEDPENREHTECENEDLPCWVENTVVVSPSDKPHAFYPDGTSYTRKFCLACGVRDGLLTEKAIQDFSPTTWEHYQSIKGGE